MTTTSLPGLPGIPITVSEHLDDGTVLIVGNRQAILVGTYDPHRSPDGDEARLIVRRGMARYLEWLGEDPEQLSAGWRILNRLGYRSPT